MNDISMVLANAAVRVDAVDGDKDPLFDTNDPQCGFMAATRNQKVEKMVE